MCSYCKHTENQKKAFQWWDGLSINEMKSLTEKYHPVLTELHPVFGHIIIYRNVKDVEKIYNQENKT